MAKILVVAEILPDQAGGAPERLVKEVYRLLK